MLVSSSPFGGQQSIAIEASPINVSRLQRNAVLNAGRFRVLNVAIGRRAAGLVAIVGSRHDTFGTPPVEECNDNAVRVMSLDSLLEDGIVGPDKPMVVKLDVEGVEIDAVRGGMQMIRHNAVIICEEHAPHCGTVFLDG